MILHSNKVMSFHLITSWWTTFKYNYNWSNHVHYIDGWIPKFSFFVPIISYLILFNDKAVELFELKHIANNSNYYLGLNGVQRLRFLYFGFIFLGFSNLIFSIKKPYVLSIGNNFIDYTKICLDIYTYEDYSRIHARIEREGYYTPYGESYNENYKWDAFCTDLKRHKKMPDKNNSLQDTTTVEKFTSNWEETKNKYGDVLRQLLYENFFSCNRENLCWLTTCIVFSTIGYFFIFIASFDVFIKILINTL